MIRPEAPPRRPEAPPRRLDRRQFGPVTSAPCGGCGHLVDLRGDHYNVTAGYFHVACGAAVGAPVEAVEWDGRFHGSIVRDHLNTRPWGGAMVRFWCGCDWRENGSGSPCKRHRQLVAAARR